MSERLRLAVLGLMTLAVLGVANLQIASKEAIVRDGRTMLLRIAPVDPRSLLQGDYMALRYRISADVGRAARESGVSDGRAVVALDQTGEARFVAIHDGQDVGQGQALLRFRRRGESVRLASDALAAWI